MNNDRTDQRKTQPRHDHDAPREQRARGVGEAGRHEHESERKPSPIEPRGWRGSGVCGDSHTD